MESSLIIPAFVAGLLTFLTPCTLPLVPGYLAFLSGGPPAGRRQVFFHGLLFVVGFSAVFILLGSLAGLAGGLLFKYRLWLSRLGGLLVIFFGLLMLGVLKIPWLQEEKRFRLKGIGPGRPTSSLLFGSVFALGWTPCVGPILGAVLTLAASEATVGQGAFLLTVFSAGLAVPFLSVAAGLGSAFNLLSKATKLLRVVSVIGGLLLIILGLLMVTNQLGLWIAYFYRLFDFINYARLLEYL